MSDGPRESLWAASESLSSELRFSCAFRPNRRRRIPISMRLRSKPRGLLQPVVLKLLPFGFRNPGSRLGRLGRGGRGDEGRVLRGSAWVVDRGHVQLAFDCVCCMIADRHRHRLNASSGLQFVWWCSWWWWLDAAARAEKVVDAVVAHGTAHAVVTVRQYEQPCGVVLPLLVAAQQGGRGQDALDYG
jgi:hypothetical protein